MEIVHRNKPFNVYVLKNNIVNSAMKKKIRYIFI